MFNKIGTKYNWNKSSMDLDKYINIDRIIDKSYNDKEDHKISFNRKSTKNKSFQYLYYVRKQKYFKEKIYMDSKIEDVFKELKDNGVNSITRIVPYNNLVFIQYEVMR
jgi:hypothetical protein